MFCNKCGNKIENIEGVRFCHKCGNDLSSSISKINNSVIEPQPQVINQVVNEVPKVDLEKRARNKRNFIITAVVTSLIGMLIYLVITVLIIVSVISIGENYVEDSDYNYEYDDEDRKNAQEEEKVVEKEGKRIGSDEFGYITVPDNWYKFLDVDGTDAIQYSYANTWIATVFAVDTDLLDAESYATNVMTAIKDEGIEDVTGARVKVAGYDAYQVYAYYEDDNIWLVSWFFEAEDGKTHYIAIEGPDATSEFFNIPETFSVDK